MADDDSPAGVAIFGVEAVFPGGVGVFKIFRFGCYLEGPIKQSSEGVPAGGVSVFGGFDRDDGQTLPDVCLA